MRCWTGGIIVLTLLACACAKDRAAAPEAEVQLDVESPHVAWANPLEGGPIHVLFIAPRYTLRDAAELAQRLEITFDTVPLWERRRLAPDAASEVQMQSEESVLARIREALRKPHDVVIVGNLDLNVLPVEIQSEIFRQVSGGTGLLLANHDPAQGIVYETFAEALTPLADAAPITRGLGADITPEWYGGPDLVHAATYGEGRVLQLAYREDKPLTHCVIPALANPLHAVPEFLDSYFSLVARGVLWTAKRESDLWVEQVDSPAPAGPPEEEIPPDLPPEFVQTMRDSAQQTPIRIFHVRFNRAADRAYRVSVQLREPNRGLRVVYRDLPELKKGAFTYPVEVLAGPGRYLLDIWVHGKHGVILWHTAPITIEGWPSFSGLTLAKGVLLPHDSLDLTADIRTWYGEARPVTLYVRGVDSLGRVVTETYVDCPEGGGPVDARLNCADLIARDVRVEAYAVPGPPHPVDDWELNMAACEVRLVPVRHTRVRSDPAILLDAPAAYEYNARHYLQVLRGAGVDGAWTDSGEAAYRHLGRLNLRSIASVEGSETAEASALPWADAEFARTEGQRLQDTARQLASEGVLDYSLDACALLLPSISERDLPDSALPAFRKWLKHEYKTPDALNRVWGTSFASWDEVSPEAADAQTSAVATEVCRFQVSAFAAFLNAMREHIRAVDRYARAGIRIPLADAPSSAYNLRALANGLDWVSIWPDEPHLSKLLSYARGRTSVFLELRPESFLNSEEARWLPWKAVASGCSGLWLPAPYAGGPTAGTALLYPDGRLTPQFQVFADSCRPLQSGLAQLLRTASPQRPNAAIYDSDERMFPKESEVVQEGINSQRAILEALRALGYGVDFLGADDLAANRLLEYSLLVLPAARALKDHEAGAIRDFLSHGGHVLADAMPGSCDGHGDPRAEAVLARDFGVELLSGSVRPEAMPLDVAMTDGTGQVQGHFSERRLDAPLALTDGKSLAQSTPIPAWIVHGGPSGSSLLLNHLFPGPGSPEDFSTLCRLLGTWMVQAGIKPLLDFQCVSGGPFDGEVRRWSLGETEFYLFLREPDHGPEEQTLRLNLDKGGHLFDLCGHARVASEQRPRLQLRRGQPLLLARMSYELTALELAVPKSVLQGARLPVSLTLRSNGHTCGTHLVSTALRTVRGEHLEHYDRITVCEKGNGEFYLPLALNDLPGHYILDASDLITGLKCSAYVQIRQRVT